jgi:hypothetical protein
MQVNALHTDTQHTTLRKSPDATLRTVQLYDYYGAVALTVPRMNIIKFEGIQIVLYNTIRTRNHTVKQILPN